MDRLPWSRWHWLVVTALGITWVLDGLEVSIVAALGPVLTHTTTLHLTESEVGLAASAYLAGSVLGAVGFSYLTDRQGRKKWFMITLLLYLTATVLTAVSWNLWSFMLFRFLTGAGIGGEYAAINSAIDEPSLRVGAGRPTWRSTAVGGWDGSRRAPYHCIAEPSSHSGTSGMAPVLRLGSCPGCEHRAHPAAHPGKPPLAHDPSADGGSGSGRLQDRRPDLA
jgi:hypothetical protein